MATKKPPMTEKEAFMRAALSSVTQPTTAGKPKFIGPPAAIVPFSDWNYYYTKDVLEWRSDTDSSRAVNVPVGFVTDLASIPPLFWTLLPKAAAYSYPAIIHDYLYWVQPCARGDADEILRAAMIEVNVEAVKVTAIYQAVRLAGGGAWTANSAAREKGEKRILKLFPTDIKISWDQWKVMPNVFV